MNDRDKFLKISFNEDDDLRKKRFLDKPPSKIIQWVMSHSGGLIKNENQASFVVFILSVFAIITSLLLVSGTSSSYEEKIIPRMPAAGD